MNFQKAIGLSYSRSSQMAGDHLKIRNILELNIRAEAISAGGNSFNGTHAELTSQEISAFNAGTFYQNITINGQSFGEGYVSNLQADPEGPDVQKKTYTATITITKPGELEKVLSSIDNNISQYIDNISENYNEQQEIHRKSISHTCSIKLNAPTDISGQINQILNGILADRNKLQSLFNIDPTDIYIFKNYSYDSKSQSYNFEQTREWVENDLSDNFNIIINQGSFQYSNGIITATFSVNITNIQSGGNIESRAQAALTKAVSYLNAQADSIFSSYSKYVTGEKDNLKNNIKTIQSLTFNRNEANCVASVTYSNSADIQDEGLVYWEYDIEKQELPDEIIISEQGNIIGSGKITNIDEINGSSEKYNNANQFFESNCSLNAAKTRAGNIGKCISQSISRGYGEGAINYRYSFSDNKSLLYNDNDGGEIKERKKIISNNNQSPLLLHSTFIIPEHKELLQKQLNILPNLKIHKSTISTNSKCSISDFKNNLFIPSDTSVVENFSISFSPSKRECVCETTYFEILN
jgi:hypothetical protein